MPYSHWTGPLCPTNTSVQMFNVFSEAKTGNTAKGLNRADVEHKHSVTLCSTLNALPLPCLKTFCLEWRHTIYWHKDMTTYAYVLLSAGLGQNLVWKQSKMGLRVAFASLTLHRNTQLKNTDWKKLLTKGVNSSEFCAYGQRVFQLIPTAKHQ